MTKDEKLLIAEYKRRKSDIKKRLDEFSLVHQAPDEDIFSELCFCIFTANANAVKCNEAIQELKAKGLLLKAHAGMIRPQLKGRVRFHNKKAEYMVLARKLLSRNKRLAVKEVIKKDDIIATRDWLVENIKGYGYKEASHFLRNIGFGRDIAILDRHILKNLKRYNVIERIPDSVASRKIYMDIEDRMKRFSKRIDIPMDELDLLFWSIQTGFIFK